jgi:thiamine biosynthesis lipoprotein
MAAGPSLDEEVQLRRFILPGLFVLALFIALWVRRPAPEPPHWRIDGDAFGTTYSVQLVVEPDGATQAAVQSALTAQIDRVNAQMSTYHADSELSTLNRSEVLEATAISAPLALVLEEAIRVHARSGGAFDVTIGPLVNAWGFGPEIVTPPSQEVLAEARAKVGTDKLTLDREASTLARAQPGLYIDLSAIAKGYAVDAMGDAIEQAGHHRYLVELGGEVRARGTNVKGQPWSVGIEAPDGGAQDVFEQLPLRDLSIATSGNYRNVRTVDGTTITHILDARTGEAVSHGLGSVSVLHPSCMTADAFATALYVLGTQEGRALAERDGIAALFLSPGIDGAAPSRITTTAYEHLAFPQPSPR